MKNNFHIVEDLIRWGFQPLAVVGDTKKPVHQKWQIGSFSIGEILESKPKRFALRMGDHGLQAIDVDIKNSSNPAQFLSSFLMAFHALGIAEDRVIIQTTLSGGVHLVYRTDNPLQSRKLAKNDTNGVLVETRGVKGCIVIYELEKFSNLENLPILTNEEENSLLSVSMSFDRSRDSSDFRDFNLNNQCLDLLENEGWKVVSENDRWYELLRPGNTTSTSSGKVFKDTNRAFIWSTSTSLPTEQRLAPAALMCHLKFDGDWSAFSKSLSRAVVGAQNDTGARWNIFERTRPNEITQRPSSHLPKPLLGGLWQEDELCIFFGPTNTGKSILTVEIANAIANGEGLFNGLLPSSGPRKVLYVDFEQSSGQFQIRYQNRVFHNDFERIVPNWDVADLKDFKRRVVLNMEQWVTKLGARVLIVDNLSVVNPDNTQAGDAAELVQSFRRIRSKLGISIMLVGHTPKLPWGQRIELQNLAGSAQMSNLIDSCFSLNRFSPLKVYIKQLKQRNDEQLFGSGNVIIGSIVKDPFVRFNHIGFGDEGKLLSEIADFSTRNESIQSDYKTGQFTQRQLGDKYNLSKSRINEVIQGFVRPVVEDGLGGLIEL